MVTVTLGAFNLQRAVFFNSFYVKFLIRAVTVGSPFS